MKCNKITCKTILRLTWPCITHLVNIFFNYSPRQVLYAQATYTSQQFLFWNVQQNVYCDNVYRVNSAKTEWLERQNAQNIWEHKTKKVQTRTSALWFPIHMYNFPNMMTTFKTIQSLILNKLTFLMPTNLFQMPSLVKKSLKRFSKIKQLCSFWKLSNDQAKLHRSLDYWATGFNSHKKVIGFYVIIYFISL